VKPAVSARSSTTTFADDDDLKLIPLAIGQYEIELVGFWTQSTTNTQKIKTRWVFSGTWNSPIRSCFGPGATNTATTNAVTPLTVSGYVSDSSQPVYSSDNLTSYSTFLEKARNVTVTVAGNLSMQWAQNASSGNATNLQAGTSFTVRRIS
jgi:hypothetical protein